MKTADRHSSWKFTAYAIGMSLLLLGALAFFIASHRTEAAQFTLIVIHAKPEWVLLAVFLQACTYLCAGGVWNAVIRAAGHRVSLRALARFSVEKLSMDQLLPLGGISGNLAVFQAMRRLGLPHRLAVEALLVDVFAHYIAYALTALVAIAILWTRNALTPVVVSLFVVFILFLLMVPSGLLWMVRHRESGLPPRLMRVRALAEISHAVRSISRDNVFSPRLLCTATGFSCSVFLLDAVTLWAVMHLTGVPVDIASAFVALVVASIAGTISFLPGGIGGFEAGCVFTLHLLGAPVEAALTGTLLLRGLSLWLPLLPGLYMVRRDIQRSGGTS
jgi:uncharacterized protein (TIRG00374 family)